MEDYSKKSDFEVNRAVFFALKIEHDDVFRTKFDNNNSVLYGDGEKWVEFDPCNNPSDMWPLIVDNEMDVCHIDSHDIWKAFAIKDTEIISYEDKNPLRASAIVFLMLNDKD